LDALLVANGTITMNNQRILATVIVLAVCVPAQAAPQIRLKGKIDGKSKVTFDVTGIDAGTLTKLAKAKMDTKQWNAVFSVKVVSDQKTVPALLGSYRIEDGVLRFEPRFPPVMGVRYRAVFDPPTLPGGMDVKPITAEFIQPKPEVKPTTVVQRIYPTRAKLPENQLKFYLHFSAPMSRGEAYRHIQLLDAKGKPVSAPFLELDEELWDADGKRFTLFFDPGRIKRGLKPREDVGPSLEEGKTYTLVIDQKWADAEGNPLKESYRKKFSVGPPDDQPPDPKKWKIAAPMAGKSEPLVVHLLKPLDHALLHRLLWVIDADGKKVPGKVAVSDEETLWQFTPERPWRAGDYHLVIDTLLEDLAGNSIGRPFEVDEFKRIDRNVKTATVKVAFRVKAPK
jgi:hypothetical protein